MALNDSIDIICQILSDYSYYHDADFVERHGTPGIQPDHVSRWLEQFDSAKREDFAQAFSNVLSKSYISKEDVAHAANFLLTSTAVTNNDALFFQNASFLDIQNNGQSQKVFLQDFIIPKAQGLNIPYSINDLSKNTFLYFDDVLFSGGRIGDDLEAWIKNIAPQSCNIVCIFIFIHTYGIYNAERKLKKVISDSGKNIAFRFCYMREVNNKRTFPRVTDVLHPRVVPQEATTFYNEIAQASRFTILRGYEQAAPSFFFANEAERSLLEEQFVIAGLKIISQLTERKSWKPLGLEGFPSFGFGSTVVTYRNCPNISPLALWWGGQDAASIWYPLVPRRGYNNPVNVFAGLFDAKV